ncbi:hypothetical protein YC2023_033196 [Brassica napus]
MTSGWPPVPRAVRSGWPPAPWAVTSGWPPAPRAVSSAWPPAPGAVARVWPPGVRSCVPRVTRFGYSFSRFFFSAIVLRKIHR